MGTNNYIARLKAQLDQAIIQREHWKKLAESRNSILVTEVCPESRSVEECIVDADSVRASWRLIRSYREQIEALRVALLEIASANPAERGIEWAKSYASDGLKGAGSDLYARWLDTLKEAEALRAENVRLRQAMQRLVTTHCAAAAKNNATDAELEQCLAAGIAQLEAERDALRQQLADSDAAPAHPAGCKVVPVELLGRTICRLTHGHEHDKAVRELRALLASAEGVKDE